MSRPMNLLSWPVLAGALLVAAAAGFGLAQLTHRVPAAGMAEVAMPPGDTVAIRPVQLQTMGIAVETVEASNFAAGIEAPGSVVASPGGEAVVTSQASGAVSRLDKRLGDPVRAGEVLALVASREAAGMAADRQVADARANLARSNLARERSLFDQRVSPRVDLERAQAEFTAAEAEARRARTAAATARVTSDGASLAIISPINGRITASAIALGGFVQPGAELFRVSDPRQVQLEAAVPALDARRIRPGDRARATTSGGERIAATVRSVTPSLDPETRAATAVLAIPSGASLTPGEAVRVEITPSGGSSTSTLVVPEEAVQSVGGRDVVFLRTASGFKAQPVTVAGRSGGRAAISSGIEAGQTIATRNAFLLKAELTKETEEEE